MEIGIHEIFKHSNFFLFYIEKSFQFRVIIWQNFRPRGDTNLGVSPLCTSFVIWKLIFWLRSSQAEPQAHKRRRHSRHRKFNLKLSAFFSDAASLANIAIIICIFITWFHCFFSSVSSSYFYRKKLNSIFQEQMNEKIRRILTLLSYISTYKRNLLLLFFSLAFIDFLLFVRSWSIERGRAMGNNNFILLIFGEDLESIDMSQWSKRITSRIQC